MEEQKMKVNNLQSPVLQISLLNKSVDLTFPQCLLQDRTLVLCPSPHVLLQDDHVSHEDYSGGSEKNVFLVIYLLMIKAYYIVPGYDEIISDKGVDCSVNYE